MGLYKTSVEESWHRRVRLNRKRARAAWQEGKATEAQTASLTEHHGSPPTMSWWNKKSWKDWSKNQQWPRKRKYWSNWQGNRAWQHGGGSQWTEEEGEQEAGKKKWKEGWKEGGEKED